MERQGGYVTKLELIETQQDLKSDVTKRIQEVDDKVDNLRDIVLPLVESSKQTAENTKRIAEGLDKFTEAQRNTNGSLYKRLNNHDVALEGVQTRLGADADTKKANATVIVSVLSVVGIIIGGLFALAPQIFS